MQLSRFFTLEEVIASQTAARLHLDNYPPPDIIERLQASCLELDKVRQALGVPVLITSGYRSIAVNEAVGGAGNSHHPHGSAFDLIAPGFGPPLAVALRIRSMMRAGEIRLHELIHEFGAWCHVAFALGDEVPARRVVTVDKFGDRLGLQEVRK